MYPLYFRDVRKLQALAATQDECAKCEIVYVSDHTSTPPRPPYPSGSCLPESINSPRHQLPPCCLCFRFPTVSPYVTARVHWKEWCTSSHMDGQVRPCDCSLFVRCLTKISFLGDHKQVDITAPYVGNYTATTPEIDAVFKKYRSDLLLCLPYVPYVCHVCTHVHTRAGMGLGITLKTPDASSVKAFCMTSLP